MEDATETRDGRPVRSVLVAVVLTVVGILGADLFTTPALLLDPALIDTPDEASLELRTLVLTLNFVGMAAVGALYLAITDRGWAYVDLRMPTRRDWVYVLGGIGATILLYLLTSLVISLLSLPASDNQIVQFIGDDVVMIGILMVIAFLFNAPAEEFLFRNVVQKRLYEAFTRLQSVFIASFIFAVIHVPVYLVLAESTLAALVPVAIVFGGGLIFGYIYVKTDNLVVPILSHAVYNSAIFGLLYVSMVYDLEEGDSVPGFVFDVVGATGL